MKMDIGHRASDDASAEKIHKWKCVLAPSINTHIYVCAILSTARYGGTVVVWLVDCRIFFFRDFPKCDSRKWITLVDESVGRTIGEDPTYDSLASGGGGGVRMRVQYTLDAIKRIDLISMVTHSVHNRQTDGHIRINNKS